MDTNNIGVLDFLNRSNLASIYVRSIRLAQDRYQAVEQFDGGLAVELKAGKVLTEFVVNFQYDSSKSLTPSVTVSSRKDANPNAHLLVDLTTMVSEFVRENRRSLCVDKSYPLISHTKHMTKLQKLRDTLFVSKPDDAGYVLLAYEDLRGEARIAKSGNVIHHSDFVFALKERLNADHLGKNGEDVDDAFSEKVSAVASPELKAIA